MGSMKSNVSLKNKYKSYNSDSYSSRMNDKRDIDIPKKYENNYILGANLQDGKSSYSNSEATNSPYIKKDSSFRDSYLSNNKKILYGDDYDNLNRKDYTNKNLIFDTEELGKELDSLLNHIRTTRNNTTYGLFDKKYKYKSYSYDNPTDKDDYSSSSLGQRMNTIGDYTSNYSSLNNNNSYYSQNYLMNNNRNSKFNNYGK